MRLSESLKRAPSSPIIAEVKAHSPELGDLLRGRDPVEIAKAYERAGAPAISYVTEPRWYGGSFEVFKEICESVSVPVLRKDFIHSEEELERTAKAGGSAVLLIARVLRERVLDLARAAHRYGVEPLVEVYELEELSYLKGYSGLVGINNRDVLRLEVGGGGVERTVRLAPRVREALRPELLISESGIRSVADAEVALKYADALLIGTALMLAEDPADALRAFLGVRRDASQGVRG
ncbi:indole-3-glycerol phosphate synthase [Candidatus Geothermarchaeota archaeon ex4572_27]|nr:MAG: indole-3-glycerol phosphate synthase [Candidatus Geothermarchaeota archaeon ex4572_27]